MSGVIAEAVHALLDEMSAFMLSLQFENDVVVLMYATILACFKGMTGETDTNKAMSQISKDPTVKTFEGTFKLPMTFVNETYEKVVTASAGKVIKRPPPQRHIEFTYNKPKKPDVNDSRTVIRQYRNRSLKSQPSPMYIIVYDMQGKARGTIPLGTNFKNQLLKEIYKKGSSNTPEFTPTVNFGSDIELKTTNIQGIPKSLLIGEDEYNPVAYVGEDVALYAGKDSWLVKLSDGRVVAFFEKPSIEKLKAQNYPVPTEYTRWEPLPEDSTPESSPKDEAIDEHGNEEVVGEVEQAEIKDENLITLVPEDVKAKASSQENAPQGKRADHYNEDGFWVGAGGAASGILPLCTSTGRIGLAWRSSKVSQGDCWGTIGGAIKRGLSPIESAKEELVEETGYHGGINLIPAFVFTSGAFKYHNFLGLVPSEFKLNPMHGSASGMDFDDENDTLVWFSWGSLIQHMEEEPDSFHEGLAALLEHSGDQIREICGISGNSSTVDLLAESKK